MSLEDSIKDVISKKLEDGTIEKLLSEQLENGITNVLKDLFRSYGDVAKVIEEKIKSVMIPYLEGYDYSEYITKLDSVLVEVLKSSAVENKRLLSNFKELMVFDYGKKTIKASELYEAWCKFVAKEVNTDELEVEYDDGVSYEPVEVSLDIEYQDRRSWSSFEDATLILECEHDEKMNFEIRLSRWEETKDKTWSINYKQCHELHSLRYLNKFEIFLMKLDQVGIKLEIDTECESDEITPEKEPEVSYN